LFKICRGLITYPNFIQISKLLLSKQKHSCQGTTSSRVTASLISAGEKALEQSQNPQ